jgi:hypothetical protein
VDPASVDGHIHLLVEAGLIEAKEVPHHLRQPVHGRLYPTRLTWAGHDFLDAIRRDRVWEKVKAEGADLPFGVVKELAIATLRAMIGLG